MPVDSSWLRQGAVNVKQGSADIVGVGTLWKGQITAGDLFLGPDGAWYEVAAAAADTSLQLRTPYKGATAGNQPYAVVRNFTAQPWSDTASRLSEMVLLWRMTLKGFNDVLRSDAPTVTLYDEDGAGSPVMSWKGADKAIKDAMASIETARKVVVDGSADLLAYRDAAGASAKAAKGSQDAAANSAKAAATSASAADGSNKAAKASQDAAAGSAGAAAGSAAAADDSAKSAKSSQDAAAASAQAGAGSASAADASAKAAKTSQDAAANSAKASASSASAAEASNKAAKASQGAAADSASAAAVSATAADASAKAAKASQDAAADSASAAAASATASDGSAKAAANSAKAAASSEAKLKDAAAAVEAAKQIATTKADKATTLAGYGIDDGPLCVFRGELSGQMDINDCRLNGWYRQAANANAASGSNYPPLKDAGALTVQTSGNMTFQQYQTYSYRNTQLYFRSLYNGQWGEWRRVWHDANFDPTTKADKATTLAGYGITDAQPQSANLAALAKLDAVGLYTRTGAGGATVRTLTAGQGISVTNGDGKAGNPAIGLSSDSATALQRVRGTIKEVFVPGDRDTFYPVGVSPDISDMDSGYVMSVRVSRPWVHKDQDGLGSYSADVWARLSRWGNTVGEVFSIMQRQGNGTYTWGLGRVEVRGRSRWLILWLRGGMSHTIQLLDIVSDLKILMPGKDGKLVSLESAQYGNEVWEPLKGDDKQPLYGLLNVETRPHAPLQFNSLEKADAIFVPRPATDTAGANGYLIPGAYRVELGGHSALLADIQCDGGSTPRLQLIARYGNELWFRTARDRHEVWDGVGLQQNRIWHSGNFDPSAPRAAAQFTRATLPAAGSMPGGIAYITDGPSGPTHVFSNGQKWRVPALTDL